MLFYLFCCSCSCFCCSSFCCFFKFTFVVLLVLVPCRSESPYIDASLLFSQSIGCGSREGFKCQVKNDSNRTQLTTMSMARMHHYTKWSKPAPLISNPHVLILSLVSFHCCCCRPCCLASLQTNVMEYQLFRATVCVLSVQTLTSMRRLLA